MKETVEQIIKRIKETPIDKIIDKIEEWVSRYYLERPALYVTLEGYRIISPVAGGKT
jgi:hypothetical protein